MSQVSWFGIDFGTTNSAASSFYGPDAQSAISSNFGDDLGRPFPSLVGINKETGEVITGRDAKDQRNKLSEQYEFFSSIKTILDQDVSYKIAGKTWKPVDIAAEIFKGLRGRIKERSNGLQDCKEAVVAVPIGFPSKKKAVLRSAAKKAGISVRNFVSEPTAAFCSNYANLRSCKTVAVFDWGGGTLDVSILKIENGNIYEVETNGINIAGDDIDKKIAEKFHMEICEEKGWNLSFDDVDPEAKDELLLRSEDAKIKFSTDEEVVGIRMLKGKYRLCRAEMNYEYFAELIEPEVTAALNCLESTISKAGLNATNIDKILCVGGSSKLKPFREKIIGIYGEEKLYFPEKVMWDISRGASIVCMSTGGYGLNQDIGLLLNDREFYPLLHKGQRLPCPERVMNFATVDDEKEARFIITDENRSFKQYISVPCGGFMNERFEVCCFIDPDLLFRLRIRSTKFQKQYLCLWTYDRLKIFYCIEGSR